MENLFSTPTGGFDLSKLLADKQFIQYLSSAGTDVAQGTGFKNLNSAVVGNIKAQNYMKMLQKMLGGQIPAGGKMQITDKNASFTVPHTTGEGAPGGASGGAPTGEATNQNLSSMNIGGNAANPFLSGQSGSQNAGYSASDLAGLTPQEISSALGIKMNQDKMAQQKINDLVNNLYKTALTNESMQTYKNKIPRVPITLSDGTQELLTRDQYIKYQQMSEASKTSLRKDYEFAKSKGYKGTIMDFKDSASTGHIKDYRLYAAQTLEQGKTPINFNDWLTKFQKSGATRISMGEKVETAGKIAEIKTEQDLNSPALPAAVDKIMKSNEIQDQLMEPYGSVAYKRHEALLRDKVIRRQIESTGGQILGTKMKGTTRVYKVKYPSGRVAEVKYVF